MLLNLSNHPSVTWPEEQTAEAVQSYGKIEDLPFPAVDPRADPDEVSALAESYFRNIIVRAVKDKLTIHLMGEMTFTFALVQRLLAAGIPCVASTTERTVTEEGDGRKTVQFRFVRFRKYSGSLRF